MSNFKDVARALRNSPGYTLMRGVARFPSVRVAARRGRSLLQAGRTSRYLEHCEGEMTKSLFPSLNRESIVAELRDEGVALGITLPTAVVDELVQFSVKNPCFADRDPRCGFPLQNRAAAEAALGKPILVAQYFNVDNLCSASARLSSDPALRWIAAKYLESVPVHVGTNLWWTFPVTPLAADKDRHAHLFHRDV